MLLVQALVSSVPFSDMIYFKKISGSNDSFLQSKQVIRRVSIKRRTLQLID